MREALKIRTGRDTGSGHIAETFPGLVWGYAFDEEGVGKVIDGDAVATALTAETGWVWLHLNLANARCRDWLSELAPLPEDAKAVLLDEDEHLSLTSVDGALTGVFADFRREFDHGTQDLTRLRFVLHGRVLITCRRHALHAAEEVRLAVGAGKRFETGDEVLELIFETFAHQVGAMAKELAATLEKIEDRVVEDRLSERDVRLGPVRRTTLRLSRQLGALRLHFSAFVGNAERSLPEPVYAMVERVSIRLDGLGRDIEAIQERARILQEEVSAKLADEANRQLQALSAMTALFLPATLVTGMFGMNTHGLPFDTYGDGFWYACLAAALGSGVVYVLLRHLGIMK
jgi:Mg2+ and Co2+ transporter CorA